MNAYDTSYESRTRLILDVIQEARDINKYGAVTSLISELNKLVGYDRRPQPVNLADCKTFEEAEDKLYAAHYKGDLDGKCLSEQHKMLCNGEIEKLCLQTSEFLEMKKRINHP